MNRNTLHFLYNISKEVHLNNEVLNELSDEKLYNFFQSGEISSIGKTICSTLNILLPYFSNIENRLLILEDIPDAYFLEAKPIIKPPSPKYGPPVQLSEKKKQKRHTR
jgi:hypothetical protein